MEAAHLHLWDVPLRWAKVCLTCNPRQVKFQTKSFNLLEFYYLSLSGNKGHKLMYLYRPLKYARRPQGCFFRGLRNCLKSQPVILVSLKGEMLWKAYAIHSELIRYLSFSVNASLGSRIWWVGKRRKQGTAGNWEWCVNRGKTHGDKVYLLYQWGQAYLDNNFNSWGVLVWKIINKKDRGKVFMIENTCLKGADKCFVILNLQFIT